MNKQFILTLARETAKIYLNKGIIIKLSNDSPDWIKQKNYKVFVQFIDYANNLRSQAGSLLNPVKENLGNEIIYQTIKSITGNGIFKPISKVELNGLKIKIFIIIKQEPIFNLNNLNPVKDGVLVIKNNNNFGYALPQRIDATDLVQIACQNGKIDYKNDKYKIFRLIINKFFE